MRKSQNIPRTVWSSEDGEKRPPLPPPNPTTERLKIIKSFHVGFGGGVRRTEGANSLPPQQQTVYLHRESKERGGKAVTLLKGLVLSKGDMSALAKTLKQACGSGGTVKDGVIEIQGENRKRIADTLRKLGYKIKLAGG